jgi:hypothetical protein
VCVRAFFKIFLERVSKHVEARGTRALNANEKTIGAQVPPKTARVGFVEDLESSLLSPIKLDKSGLSHSIAPVHICT